MYGVLLYCTFTRRGVALCVLPVLRKTSRVRRVGLACQTGVLPVARARTCSVPPDRVVFLRSGSSMHPSACAPCVFIYTHYHMYICIYIYICIHICIHTHVRVYIYIYIRIYIYISIIYIYIYTYIQTYVHTDVHINLVAALEAGIAFPRARNLRARGSACGDTTHTEHNSNEQPPHKHSRSLVASEASRTLILSIWLEF